MSNFKIHQKKNSKGEIEEFKWNPSPNFIKFPNGEVQFVTRKERRKLKRIKE